MTLLLSGGERQSDDEHAIVWRKPFPGSRHVQVTGSDADGDITTESNRSESTRTTVHLTTNRRHFRGMAASTRSCRFYKQLGASRGGFGKLCGFARWKRAWLLSTLQKQSQRRSGAAATSHFCGNVSVQGVSDRIWQQVLDAAVSYGLTALLLLTVIVMALKARSWYREDSDPAAAPEDLLLHFRDLHRRGHLSETEFRSIKGQLVHQPGMSLAESTETAPSEEASDGQSEASQGS